FGRLVISDPLMVLDHVGEDRAAVAIARGIEAVAPLDQAAGGLVEQPGAGRTGDPAVHRAPVQRDGEAHRDGAARARLPRGGGIMAAGRAAARVPRGGEAAIAATAATPVAIPAGAAAIADPARARPGAAYLGGALRGLAARP